LNNTPENPKFDVEYIAKTLSAKKGAGQTILFLGARTGSLFRRNTLVEKLKQDSILDLSKLAPVERFRECFKILESYKNDNQDSDIRDIIHEALQAKRLEAADLCVAELMKEKIFSFIITTNIGDELELAFQYSDIQEHTHFEVATPEHGKTLLEKKEGHLFKLIKVNGTGYTKLYGIGQYTIDSDTMYLDHYPDLETSLEQIKDRNMLMVGFDYEWDGHILKALLPRTKGTFWYVNEEQTKEDSALSFYLQKSKRIEGTIGSYELFFMNLCWYILGTIPLHPVTRDQIERMQKALDEARDTDSTLRDIGDTQDKLQENVDTLTKTVNQRFKDQETTINSIKDGIHTLLERSTPKTLSSSNTSATPPQAISGAQEEDGERPGKESEEKE